MRPAGVQVSVIVSVQEPHMIVAFSLWWDKEEIILELLNPPPQKKKKKYIMQYPTLTLRGAVEKFVLLFESVNLCSYSKIKPFKTFLFTHELPFLLFII